MAELHKAIQHMQTRKAPGQDGLPAEFYKELWTAIAPSFYRTVKDFKESGTLSPDINSANICLLLIPNKDPTLSSSYHPITFKNADLKIIHKAKNKTRM